MIWNKKITDRIADVLRHAAYLFLALDAIVLSGFLFWLIVRFVWRFAQFIDHRFFENPWF